MLQQYLKEILTCTTCGQCRAVCPVFGVTGWESANARGKVLIAYGLLKDELKIDESVVKRLYECTFCTHCDERCSSKVVVTDIINATRQYICEMGFLPDVHKKIIMNLKTTCNPFGEDDAKRTEFLPDSAKKQKCDILLFIGCTALYQDIGITKNVIELLNKLNVEYFTLGSAERCCGYISYLAGSVKFKEIAQNTYNQILNTGAKKVITTCAGCYKTFKALYPKCLGKEIDIKILHIAEMLASILEERTQKLKFKPFSEKKEIVAYHDPCDIGRCFRIFEQPRFVINELPNVEIVEFANTKQYANCCGGGGGLKAFDTALSLKIGYERIGEAAELNATTVVSTCPACKSNLKIGAAQLRKDKGVKLKVLDLVELISKCID
jgi:glycolate oxidase